LKKDNPFLKVRYPKKNRLKKKLAKIIDKLGKAIGKAIALDKKFPKQYQLSEVEVGISLGAKYGLLSI